MKYIAKYLPVDKPWTDGCTIINASGEHHIWDESSIGWAKEQWKVAELFIVGNEFNEQVVICRPSKESMKWLKAGMEIKRTDIIFRDKDEPVFGTIALTNHIECPVCHHYPGKK